MHKHIIQLGNQSSEFILLLWLLWLECNQSHGLLSLQTIKYKQFKSRLGLYVGWMPFPVAAAAVTGDVEWNIWRQGEKCTVSTGAKPLHGPDGPAEPLQHGFLMILQQVLNLNTQNIFTRNVFNSWITAPSFYWTLFYPCFMSSEWCFGKMALCFLICRCS